MDKPIDRLTKNKRQIRNESGNITNNIKGIKKDYQRIL